MEEEVNKENVLNKLFKNTFNNNKVVREINNAHHTLGIRREVFTKNSPNTRDVIAESLMRMLIEGPEVSLRGSPTVSPTTAALWASDPFTKV
jgi:hypothetical protein